MRFNGVLTLVNKKELRSGTSQAGNDYTILDATFAHNYSAKVDEKWENGSDMYNATLWGDVAIFMDGVDKGTKFLVSGRIKPKFYSSYTKDNGDVIPDRFVPHIEIEELGPLVCSSNIIHIEKAGKKENKTSQKQTAQKTQSKPAEKVSKKETKKKEEDIFDIDDNIFESPDSTDLNIFGDEDIFDSESSSDTVTEDFDDFFGDADSESDSLDIDSIDDFNVFE